MPPRHANHVPGPSLSQQNENVFMAEKRRASEIALYPQASRGLRRFVLNACAGELVPRPADAQSLGAGSAETAARALAVGSSFFTALAATTTPWLAKAS